MLSKKVDIDRHVEYTIRRIQSENERNLRSFAFAKLYYNVSEYEQAKRYMTNYLIVRPKSAEGHLLLGNILEKLGRREAALEAYRTSLDIDPKQNGLVLKVCELLASDDVSLDASRARYWCEQARLLDPQHPAVFDLRERLAVTDKSNPEDVFHLFINELEHRPTDVALRVRLLQHMLDCNKLTEAYQHVSDIENKNLTIFANHFGWYETVAKILIRYKNENVNNTASLTWHFWMLIVSVFEKLVCLTLDENTTTSKNVSECVRAIFNLDQTLYVAADNIQEECMEKQLAQEFFVHYRAQLCLHIGTLLLKQAKKDQIKYKEAINMCIPLFLISYHSQPIELQCVWLEHTASDSIRKLVQRWHREAAFRCSQAGHTLQSFIRERRSTFADRVGQLCAGAWRERTYKSIFITRDQQLKLKTSYFVNCSQLDEVTNRLPDLNELLRYDEISQYVHPNSLHHMIWIGLNNQAVKFRCTVFDGLQYSVRNLSNCAAETLNVLDIQAFLYCCIFCAQANIEESKHLIYYNQEKPQILPAAITEPFGTLNQTKWYSCVYKMHRNESGSDLSDIRVTLIKGIEIVRCSGTHGLDVKLLVMLANTFAQKAKELVKITEIEYCEARAELYWRVALPLLEKLRNNQMITYQVKQRWFEYRGKDMTPTEINMHLEEGKLFTAIQLMKKKEHEKALQMLESLKNPYASFYQAQTYKLLADEQMSHNKENVTSEMRSQHIILLSKARDCFYLTLDRLREPSVDRKHPLNAELGTEIEKIERLLSRIDPDICANRNECDGMSDENVSSVGSVGEHVNVNNSSVNSYHISNINNSTPRHDHNHHHIMLPHVTSYRVSGIGDTSILNTSTRRAEARPSPERLDAQLRQMVAAKDATLQHIVDQNRLVMDAHRSLVDELRGFKDAVHSLTTSVDELRTVKKSVDELKLVVDDLQTMKEQVLEIKKDLTELKKDTNKLKSNQINEEDLYALEEEYGGVDYNINAAGATSAFNTAASLYPNFPQRLQGIQGAAAAAAAAANTLAYGAPGLYGMYPMYPPAYGGLGLTQPGTLPFTPDAVGVGAHHVPDFRTMGSIAQGLSHAGLTNQTLTPQQQQQQQTVPQLQPLQPPPIPAPVPVPVPAPLQFGTNNTLSTQPTNMNLFGKLSTDINSSSSGCSTSAYGKYDKNNDISSYTFNTSISSNNAAPVLAVITSSNNKVPPVNVVITASDPLPIVSSTTQAQILSVTIPPQHLKGNQKPHNYQIPLPVTTSQSPFTNIPSVIAQTPMPVATQNLLSNVAPPVYSSLTINSSTSPVALTVTGQQATGNNTLGLQIEQSLAQSFNSSTHIDNNKSIIIMNKSHTSESSILEEHDPCPDFKPIIPLPDEVPLTTGEENETILFCEHAKLYRFVDKEWRERGIGNIKLLHNELTGKVRILMRRDQVHKICANHFITEDIELTQMPRNERAYIWAANDFADENVVLEKLCVRFKTIDEAKKFSAAFERAKILLKVSADNCSMNNKEHNSLGGFVFTSTPTFKPKMDSSSKSVNNTIETRETVDDDDVCTKISPFAGFSFGLQQQLVTSSDFKPVQKMLSDSTQSEKKNSTDNTNETTSNDEFVPTTEFKPVIPLPDLVEVKTGEENCEILYEVKAKLLRFDSTSKEWKERGIGIMKILKEKTTVRLLMRREQVHKVCCNHQLLKSMVFTNMPKNNRVLNWCAQDYSENILKTEMFAIRFRTSELCDEFLQWIHCAQEMLDSSNNIKSTLSTKLTRTPATTSSSSSWGDTFKMKDGNWECLICYVSNDANCNTCIACATPRSNNDNDKDNDHSGNAQSPQKFKPSPAPTTNNVHVQSIKDTKPKIGMWLCKICYIHNDGKNKNCEACDTPKVDSVTKKDDLNTSVTKQFSFDINNSAITITNATASTTTTTTTNTISGWGDLYKPKDGAWTCEACYLSNDGATLYCMACDAPKDNTIPKKENKSLNLCTSTSAIEQKFSFGMPATTTETPMKTESTTIFGFKSQPSASAGFTFGMPQTTTNNNDNICDVTPPNTSFSFSMQNIISTSNEPVTPLNLASKPTFTFTMPTNNTSSTPPSSSQSQKFIFGSPNKHEFEFKPRSPRKVSGGDAGDESEDTSGLEEECDNIYFKPVIPLPDKVDVKTGEENEIVLYCHRAKLFRFVNGEWKERGIGDVKILKHTATGKLRVLMRREQIHKICLNHILTKQVEYKQKDNKTWLFTAPDYSEGEITYQQFCLRFKNNEIANTFMDTVKKILNDTNNIIETQSSTTIVETKNESTQNEDSDSDIEIVYETKVSAELQEKALALKLPKNFYAYLDLPPCKGCIGCNDEHFIFSPIIETTVSKPKLEFSFIQKFTSLTTPTTTITTTTTTAANIFSSVSSNIFGTPLATNISSTNSTQVYETPKSTFSFIQTGNENTFTSPFSFTSTNNTTTSNIFSTPSSIGTTSNSSTPVSLSSSNIFGGTGTGTGSILFGQTTITPVKSNNNSTSKDTSEQQKSPLAPSKLANVVTTSTQTSSTFIGTPLVFSSTPTTVVANIFASNKSQSTNENIVPPQTTSAPIFGSSIFGGSIKSITKDSATPIFGASNQSGSIFSGTTTTKSDSLFFKPTTTANIFGGDNKDTVFGSNVSQPFFGGGFSITQKTTEDQQTIKTSASDTTNQSMSFFGNLSTTTTTTTPTFGSLAALNKPKETDSTVTENKGETKTSFLFAGTGAPVFGSQKPKETEPVLKCDSNLSFSALASGAQNFITTENKGEIKPFTFDGAGSQVFGSKKLNKTDQNLTVNKNAGGGGGGGDADDDASTTEKDEDENTAEDYDPHYEPIVPLPDAIVVKTGEEDETVVFNERAKLYRFSADTKEWKERGVGQVKLLHHPLNDTYRLIMRREQVHKIVLNQLVTVEMDLQPMQTSDRAWLWAGYNYTDDGSQLEELAIRFKNPEMAIIFRNAVIAAQDYLRMRPSQHSTTSVSETELQLVQSDTVENTDDDDDDAVDYQQDDNDEDDDEEYGSDESDENKSLMFTKRCTLSYKLDNSNTWNSLGMGTIKMFYDSEMYGGRIEMYDDSGKQLSNTIIAMNTVMKVENTCCIWRAMEWTLDPAEARVFKAQYSSKSAAEEMYYNYEEALQYAHHSEILDGLPEKL